MADLRQLKHGAVGETDGCSALNGYRGVVAKKSRSRGSGPARTAARPAGSGSAKSAPAGSAPAGTAQLTAASAGSTSSTYPGQRFGLPERGPGSVSGMPRRVLALFIDWAICSSSLWATPGQESRTAENSRRLSRMSVIGVMTPMVPRAPDSR